MRTHGKTTNTCTYMLVENPESEYSLEDLGCRLQDNIEIYLKGIVRAGENWSHQAVDRDKYRAFIKAVMNVHVP